MFSLLDSFSAGISLLFLVLFELLVAGWIYGKEQSVSASASPFKSNHFTMQSLKSSHGFIIKNLTRTQTLPCEGGARHD